MKKALLLVSTLTTRRYAVVLSVVRSAREHVQQAAVSFHHHVVKYCECVAHLFQFCRFRYALPKVYLWIFVKDGQIFHKVVNYTLWQRLHHSFYIVDQTEYKLRLASLRASAADSGKMMFKRQQRHHRSRLSPTRHRRCRCRRCYGCRLRSLFCVYVSLRQ